MFNMIFTLIISGLTALFLILSVLFKPYFSIKKHKVGLYYLVCLVGAIILIATNHLSIPNFLLGITANTAVNPLKILTLFISMTLLSIYLGDAGFFELVAYKIFSKKNITPNKIFILLYAVVSILTVFTSNDIIILTFTPPLCIFCKKAKVSPIPYLIAEFISANTWSMALIVGNPTNIYLAGSSFINFLAYSKTMILPAILGGLGGLGALYILFHKSLSRSSFCECKGENPPQIKRVPMIVFLSTLFCCIVLLAISDILSLEMWIICLAFAVIDTIFYLVYSIVNLRSIKPVGKILAKAPYELIPFVLSMFAIVLALYECGFTVAIGDLLISNTKLDALTFGGISTIFANLLNNIPMSVLFEKVINGSSLYAIYGTIVGSNIGAFITPVGALAGIMWGKILREYNVKLSFFRFSLYGIFVAIFTLTPSLIALYFVL